MDKRLIALVIAVVVLGGKVTDPLRSAARDAGELVGFVQPPPPNPGATTIVLVDQGPASLANGSAYLADFKKRSQQVFDASAALQVEVVARQAEVAGAEVGDWSFRHDPEVSADADAARRSGDLGAARTAVGGLLPSGAPCPTAISREHRTTQARSALLESIPATAKPGTTIVLYSHGVPNSGSYNPYILKRDPQDAAERRRVYLDYILSVRGIRPGDLRGVTIVLPSMGVAAGCAKGRDRAEVTAANLRTADAKALWKDFGQRTGAKVVLPGDSA